MECQVSIPNGQYYYVNQLNYLKLNSKDLAQMTE